MIGRVACRLLLDTGDGFVSVGAETSSVVGNNDVIVAMVVGGNTAPVAICDVMTVVMKIVDSTVTVDMGRGIIAAVDDLPYESERRPSCTESTGCVLV